MRKFADFNPIAVTVWFLAVTGLAMFSSDPVIYVIAMIGAVLLYITRNGRKNHGIHLFAPVLFIVTALINPLVSHNGATVLFVMNDNPVTLEALIYGVCTAVMITAVLYLFKSYSQIMTSDRLLYVFGAFSPKLALIFSMSLRYVPLFGRQAKKITYSQTAMGLYKDDNIADSFKGGMRIFSVLITWALENGIITADSMTARGYGIGRRSHFSLFKFRTADILLICLSIIFSALTVYLTWDIEFVFYPYFKIPDAGLKNAVGYAMYGFAAAMPVFIEIREVVKWRYLRSKI